VLHPGCQSGSIIFFRTGYFVDPLFKIGLSAERQSQAASPLSERRENQRRAMINNRKLCLGAGLATVLRILLVAAQAQNSEAPTPAASQPGATPAEGGELQQITVTGYLIPRVGDGPQPVTTYDQDYIQKTGYQTATDVLQALPGAVGNFGPNTTTGFSFSPGSASVGLKGLPPNDTLVLVDGLRYPAYPFAQASTAATISFVDLNSFPLAAIDRIEILNDGGSATYGTDAIAGVINVILKDDYNGADIFNYYGISQRGDDDTYHGSFVGGISQKLSDTSKVNITAALDYYSSGPIMFSDRPFNNVNFNLLSFKYPSHPIFPTYAGNFSDAAGNFYQVLPGTVPPISTADFSINGPSIPSFNEKYVQLLPRESRLGGMVKINYEPTSWLKLYDSILIQRNEELSSFGPNQGIYPPSSFNSGGVTVPASNPYNPFHIPLTVDGLALGEFGPLRSDTTITTIREVAGATIQMPWNSWIIDANILYGESDGTETNDNSFTVSGLNAALNGTLPGHIGQFFNPFADESVVGPNRAFYGDKQLVASIWEDNRSDILQYHLTAGGTLIELPAGPLTVAGGFEYRSEELIQNEDANSKNGNVAGFQFTVGQLTSARRYIWSIFGEIDIPIVGNQWSWPGLRNLDIQLSERQDYYSDFGSAAKPKFAIRYKPFNDLTFRATYSEGFVAPSLAELFGAPLPAEAVVVDPKNPQVGQETVVAPTNGNPRLKPENAYTYYLGAVWSPGSTEPEHSPWGWANGFSVYINWFQVDQHNVIGTLTQQDIVDLGSSAPAGNFVVRSPNGQITEIVNTYLNLGDSRNDGIEFGLTYNTKEFNWGKLELEFDGSYLYNISDKTVQGLLPNGAFFYRVFDETDSFGAPNLKLLASAFYSKTIFGSDTVRTGFTLHYTGWELDANNTFNGTNPAAAAGLDFPGYIHVIGNWTTLDWQISYRFGQPELITPETPKPGYDKEGKKVVGEQAVAPPRQASPWGLRNLLANTTLTFGISNIFDTYPPLSVDNVQGNYDANVGNPVMRFFYVSVEKKF